MLKQCSIDSKPSKFKIQNANLKIKVSEADLQIYIRVIRMQIRVIRIAILLLIFLSCGNPTLAFWNGDEELDFESGNKKVTVCDEGICGEIASKDSKTIEEFLEKEKIGLGEKDITFPSKGEKLYSGGKIMIERAKKVSIFSDGKKTEKYVFGKSVKEALMESKIVLGEDDISYPSLESPIYGETKIEVIRVDIKEEIVNKDIAFKKIVTQDDKMSWREKKIKQKGVKGVEEIKYKVISHNGKEISRKVMAKRVAKDPVEEISVEGTYVKVGKTHKGLGTWYAFKGGLFAANPWLPMGSYVRVTNKENGKSVIVQINDRGPFGPNRIIDLDKVAFQKIASLGAGVIDVKMEEILN